MSTFTITFQINEDKPVIINNPDVVNKPVVYNQERINEKEDPQIKDPSIKCKHCGGAYCKRTMKRHLESKKHRFFNM